MHLSRAVTAALLAGSLGLSLAACSADDSGEGQTTSSAASNGTGDNGNAESTEQFPVTIPNAFGETTIEKAPERVASVGWANHEVPLALGVVPVGMSKTTWGDDDDNGVLPWTEDKLKELGAQTPVLFDETDGIPYEQVADTKPDVILASYSGITKEDYDTLSKIAPVVAYPELPWETSLEDMIKLNSQAVGKQAEGEQLIADLNDQTEQALQKYPNLEGKKVLFTAFGGGTDNSKIGFYTTGDPRMGFLADHGMGVPKIVEESSRTSDQFWVEVSAEKPEDFQDVDLIVAYSSGNAADDQKMIEELQKDPLKSKIPAVEKGNIAFLDDGPLGASANQSPLSIPWGIDRYFAALNEGLKA